MLAQHILPKASEVTLGIIKVSLAFLLSLSVATTAQAATQEGPYMAIDMGSSTYKDSCYQSTGNCSESGIAYRFGIGYQTNGLAFEASYRAKGGASSSQGSFTTEMLPAAQQINMIANLPVSPKTSLLLNVGLVSTSAQYNVNGTVSTNESPAQLGNTWGVGFLYEFSNDVGLRAQYESLGKLAPINGVSNKPDFPISMISAGMIFRL